METINEETIESIERNDERINAWYTQLQIERSSEQAGCIYLNAIDYITIAEAIGIAPESTKTK